MSEHVRKVLDVICETIKGWGFDVYKSYGLVNIVGYKVDLNIQKFSQIIVYDRGVSFVDGTHEIAVWDDGTVHVKM
jgi:hypothetical protein